RARPRKNVESTNTMFATPPTAQLLLLMSHEFHDDSACGGEKEGDREQSGVLEHKHDEGHEQKESGSTHQTDLGGEVLATSDPSCLYLLFLSVQQIVSTFPFTALASQRVDGPQSPVDRGRIPGAGHAGGRLHPGPKDRGPVGHPGTVSRVGLLDPFRVEQEDQHHGRVDAIVGTTPATQPLSKFPVEGGTDTFGLVQVVRELPKPVIVRAVVFSHDTQYPGTGE